MSTRKITNFRGFLTVYYVPKLSSLLATIGAKLIGPHGDLQVGKYRPSLMNRLRGMTHIRFDFV